MKESNAVNTENLIANITNINFDENNTTEEQEFELFYIHLFAKILFEYNLSYGNIFENKNHKYNKK